MHELHAQMRQRYEEWERRAEARGIRKGRKKALCDVLIGLLTQRFGSVPESVLTRVHEADMTTLARWASRVLAAESLDDVLA